jgi:uncharacterized membrane protein YdbT with pleckstrin-like domain
MRMQEPEQWQQSGQEWQEGQGDQQYSEYRTGYARENESEKIYPQEERMMQGRTLGILAIILSAIGFFPAVAGIVGSALVLEYAKGPAEILAGGVIGLVSSIIVMLVFVAIFVIAVITLARPHLIRGWQTPPVRSPLR